MNEIASKKRENQLVSLFFNFLLPIFVLSKMSEPQYLGPVYGLVAALSFPISYGIYDFWRRRHYSFIAILGFVSVLLTGGMGLLKLDGFWFAVKEATIPLLIAVAIKISQKYRPRWIENLVLNDQMMRVGLIRERVAEKKAEFFLDRLFSQAMAYLVFSFLLSACLNFALAIVILKSPSGTSEFNAELAQMQGLSFPVIALPSTLVFGFALWRFFKGLKTLTGLSFDEILRSEKS